MAVLVGALLLTGVSCVKTTAKTQANYIRLLVLLLYGFWGVVQAAELPIETFAKHGDYLSMALSPDGSKLAARARFDDKVVLLVLDTKTLQLVGGVQPDDGDILHTVTWVTDDRLVFELAMKISGYDQPVPTGELFGINANGENRKHLYGFRGGKLRGSNRFKGRENVAASQTIISTLPEDDDHILILETPWSTKEVKPPMVSRLNIHNGKKKVLEYLPYPSATPLATRDGEVKFMTWVDENNDVQSAYRQTDAEEWQPLATVFPFDTALTPLYFSRDELTVFLTGSYGERGTETLFALEIQSGDITPVGASQDTDIIHARPDVDTYEPAVLFYAPDRTEYSYPQPSGRTAKVHRMLVQSFPNRTVDLTGASRDGTVYLVHITSDVNPGEYYLFNASTLRAKQVWANRSWIDRATMRPKQPIHISASDGVTIHGYLTLPEAVPNGKRPPLVVLSHGGPHGIRDFWVFDPEVQLLANRGYAVLQVNFRGSGGYGMAFQEAGYREWGDRIMQDIIESTQWVVDEGYVDGQRICAYGTSFGAYASLMMSALAPDMFRCAVGHAGVYDLALLYSEGDIAEYWFGEAFLEDVVGTDIDELQAFSPTQHAKAIKARVMLAHGSKDQRAPEAHADRMVEALTNADNPPRYYRFSDAGHGIWNEQDRIEYYTALLAFLEDALE